TTSAGKPVTFRVFSGQLTDLNLSLDLGSGCTYRAFHPDSFDPRDPLFPIDNTGRVAVRLTDIALRTNVGIDFLSATTARGSFDAPDLRDIIRCAGQTYTPPRTFAPGTFTISR